MASDNKIDILITKFFSGEALPEEAMQLEDWANISPANKAYFKTCSAFFATDAKLTNADSKQLVWENIKVVVNKNGNSAKAKMINWGMAGVAASIVLILSLVFLLKNIFKKENNKNLYQAQALTRIISLKDSTEITLLPNSNITTDKEYGITNRKIKLNGSAHFSIIHNAYKPFIVDMNKLYIKDLGTVFSVVTSPTGDTISINVTEGRIYVYDNFGSSENVSKGEKATYIKSQKQLQVIHILQAGRILADESKEGKAGANDLRGAFKRDTHLIVSKTDSSVEKYPSLHPPSKHQLDRVYTPGGQKTIMFNDPAATTGIIDDMHKDGLIKNGEMISFKLSNREFIVNGKTQVDSVFLRYKKKYGPPINADKDWSWCHNCPPIKN